MLFNGQFQALDIQVTAQEEFLELEIYLGLGFPTPQGVMPIPFGVQRLPMNRESALSVAQKLTEAAEELPEDKKDSDLVVAQNLSGVEQALKQQEAMKKGNRPKR